MRWGAPGKVKMKIKYKRRVKRSQDGDRFGVGRWGPSHGEVTHVRLAQNNPFGLGFMD